MYHKYISQLLDQMQKKKDETQDEFKLKILNRIIAILEEYVK